MALDISRAFDRLWHAGLLHKLKSYGIQGFLWRSSFDKKKLDSELLFVVLFLGIISWKDVSCFNRGASFYPSTFVYTRFFPKIEFFYCLHENAFPELWQICVPELAKWPNCWKSAKRPVWKSIYLQPLRS